MKKNLFARVILPKLSFLIFFIPSVPLFTKTIYSSLKNDFQLSRLKLTIYINNYLIVFRLLILNFTQHLNINSKLE